MDWNTGFAVLLGMASGMLWGWHFAGARAERRLEFLREHSDRLRGEAEGMLKALSEANAKREAAEMQVERERDKVAVRELSLRHLHEHIEVLESRLRNAKAEPVKAKAAPKKAKPKSKGEA